MRSTQALAAFAGFALLHLATAQESTVLGTFVYTQTGDRTPYIFENELPLQLTPLGAHQLYDVGSFFRERYLVNPDTALFGLSPNLFDPRQASVTAQDNSFAVSSAQAFLQSFYPPAGDDAATTYSVDYDQGAFLAANSSFITTPLDGYQYPWVSCPASTDSNRIFTSGSSACSKWEARQAAYASSDLYQKMSKESASFYAHIGGVLGNSLLPVESYNYYYAYSIYDYVSYMVNHNTSFYDAFNTDGGSLPTDAMVQLRSYADHYMWAVYASANGGKDTGAIAGQTLAGAVLNSLSATIAESGTQDTLNLMFGEFNSMTGLFSLLGLGAVDSDFWGMPEPGSSAVFELFTNNPSTNFTASYPNIEELFVRFLFRNGTAGDLTAYPIFTALNNGGDKYSIAYTDFVGAITDLAIASPEAWCQTCDSWEEAPFCLAYNSKAWAAVLGGYASGSGGSGEMSNKVAGVIGAVATLCTVGLFLIGATCCFGLRFERSHRNKNTGVEGGLGGFKGGQKLASDLDVSLPKQGKGGVATVMPVEPQRAATNEQIIGHERVGSWELKNQKARSRSVSPVSVDMRQRDADLGGNPFEARPVTPRQHV